MASTYTDAQKADAVAIYVEHGLAEAHRRTGIPKPTLKRWLENEGIDPSETTARSVEKTRAATEAASAGAAEKRALLQTELLDAAREHVAMARITLDGKDAQHWMTAAAIGVDKFRLEKGEATERTEHVAAPERNPEVEEELGILYDMAEHRAA